MLVGNLVVLTGDLVQLLKKKGPWSATFVWWVELASVLILVVIDGSSWF